MLKIIVSKIDCLRTQFAQLCLQPPLISVLQLCCRTRCLRRHYRQTTQDRLFCWSHRANSSSPTRRVRGSTAPRPDIRLPTSGGWRPTERPCRTYQPSAGICSTARWLCYPFRRPCIGRTCTVPCTGVWPPTTWAPSSVVTSTSEPVSTREGEWLVGQDVFSDIFNCLYYYFYYWSYEGGINLSET